jgi:hypothetical protein
LEQLRWSAAVSGPAVTAFIVLREQCSTQRQAQRTWFDERSHLTHRTPA